MVELNEEKELIYKVKYFLDKNFSGENREKSLRSLLKFETLGKVINDFEKIELKHFRNEQEKKFLLEGLKKLQGLRNRMIITKTFIDYSKTSSSEN